MSTLGYYFYKRLDTSDRFALPQAYSARVEIVSQTDKTITVKLLTFHADGRKPGTEMKVRRKAVKIDGAKSFAENPRQIKSTNLPYSDEGRVNRLPYKDNDND